MYLFLHINSGLSRNCFLCRNERERRRQNCTHQLTTTLTKVYHTIIQLSAIYGSRISMIITNKDVTWAFTEAEYFNCWYLISLTVTYMKLWVTRKKMFFVFYILLVFYICQVESSMHANIKHLCTHNAVSCPIVW